MSTECVPRNDTCLYIYIESDKLSPRDNILFCFIAFHINSSFISVYFSWLCYSHFFQFPSFQCAYCCAAINCRLKLLMLHWIESFFVHFISFAFLSRSLQITNRILSSMKLNGLRIHDFSLRFFIILSNVFLLM